MLSERASERERLPEWLSASSMLEVLYVGLYVAVELGIAVQIQIIGVFITPFFHLFL